MGTTLKAAALQLAKAGFKIFPVPPGTKKSYISKSNVRFGSGENWGMTNDPVLIEKYWTRWPNANIGFPTGFVNGRIVVETDTKAGHSKLAAEGEEALQALEKRLERLPATLMSESPSGSIHYWFEHPGAEKRVTGGAAKLGLGIDVLGDGQMAVVPPSRRGDKVYKWLNKLPPARLSPQWLGALGEAAYKQVRSKGPSNPFTEYGDSEEGKAPVLAEIESALAEIPNDDLSWEQWNDVGMRLFRYFQVAGDEAAVLKLWDKWSATSDKYNRRKTQEKWKLFHTSPPDRYTSWSLHKLAEEGWPQLEGEDDEPEEQATKPRESGTKNSKPNGAQAKKAEEPKETNGHNHPIGAASKIFVDVRPVDFWGKFPIPEMPRNLLPKKIEKFARILSDLQGSDPASLAMGALLGCGVAIPDSYKIQPKHHDASWTESPRIWVAIVGGVSVMKSPVTSCVLEPFRKIEKRLMAEYTKQKMDYDALSAEEKKGEEEPHPIRILLEDTTSQGAQNVLRYSKDGLMCCRDELSGFFGALDQYGRGGYGVERPFWLQTFNGGPYYVTRADRNRTFSIDNLSVSFFGGVQPDVIRKLDDERTNDGLIQRLFILMAKDSTSEKDVPMPAVQEEYESLIFDLYKLPRDRSAIFKFTKEALELRMKLSDHNLDLMRTFNNISRKLAEHIGKYRGLFARLCLIWHMIEHHADAWPSDISLDTAQRVEKFMYDFLLPHAISFYLNTLGASNDHERLLNVAGYILAHSKDTITHRDMQHSVRSMRGLKSKEIEDVFSQLDGCGWIARKATARRDSFEWWVNPEVHILYEQHAVEERKRRSMVIDIIKETGHRKKRSEQYRNE